MGDLVTDAFKSQVMDLAQKARRSWKGAKHYNIFYTLKPGSLFIQNVIVAYVGIRSATYNDYNSGFRDVSINKMLEMADIDVIAKSHFWAMHNAIAFILIFGTLPNIFLENQRYPTQKRRLSEILPE